MGLLNTWEERRKPDFSKTEKVLWKDFKHFAASTQWDVDVDSKDWVSRTRFRDFLAARRAGWEAS